MLCGDTAHLHKEVLPEVVLGEFHAAIRAPSQPTGKKQKLKRKRAEAETRTGMGGWMDGLDGLDGCNPE